jgi:hypothetical protein
MNKSSINRVVRERTVLSLTEIFVKYRYKKDCLLNIMGLKFMKIIFCYKCNKKFSDAGPYAVHVGECTEIPVPGKKHIISINTFKIRSKK